MGQGSHPIEHPTTKKAPLCRASRCRRRDSNPRHAEYDRRVAAHFSVGRPRLGGSPTRSLGSDMPTRGPSWGRSSDPPEGASTGRSGEAHREKRPMEQAAHATAGHPSRHQSPKSDLGVRAAGSRTAKGRWVEDHGRSAHACVACSCRMSAHLENAARALRAILSARDPDRVWTVEIRRQDLDEPFSPGATDVCDPGIESRNAERPNDGDARAADAGLQADMSNEHPQHYE